MAQQIKFRRGTANEWSAVGNTVILSSGEPGVETDTGKFKIGDGVSVWNSLSYSNDLGTGITLTDISVGAPAAANGSGSISYNNTTGVFTYTPPVIPDIPSEILDSAAIIGIIDSDYINSKITIPTAGVDSAAIIGIIDSDYISSRVTSSGNITDLTFPSGAYGKTYDFGTAGTTYGQQYVVPMSIATGANGDAPSMGIIYRVGTRRAAWIRIYSSAADMAADSDRTLGTAADSNAGIIFEGVTSGNPAVSLHPTPPILYRTKNQAGDTEIAVKAVDLRQAGEDGYHWFLVYMHPLIQSFDGM